MVLVAGVAVVTVELDVFDVELPAWVTARGSAEGAVEPEGLVTAPADGAVFDCAATVTDPAGTAAFADEPLTWLVGTVAADAVDCIGTIVDVGVAFPWTTHLTRFSTLPTTELSGSFG